MDPADNISAITEAGSTWWGGGGVEEGVENDILTYDDKYGCVKKH